MNLSRRCHRPLDLLRESCSRVLFGVLVLLSSTVAWADLPTMEAPSRGEGSGLIDTIKNYAYDGGILLGLLLSLKLPWTPLLPGLIIASADLSSLLLACIALLAWSLLPDGPARTAAFMQAPDIQQAFALPAAS